MSGAVAVEAERRPASDNLSEWSVGRLPLRPSVAPEGWELRDISSVARLESGHTPSRRQPAYWDGDIPWLSLHDTEALDQPEVLATSHRVTQLGIDNSSARILPPGTVALSRTATVGKATILGRPMATSQDFANYVCGPSLHNGYLMHLFRYMGPEWDRLMAGSTHNTIYMDVFERLQILVPPIDEQRRIAAALDDADASIASLAKVAEKQRMVRQGALAELISGERRLVGFSGEWKVGSFADALKLINSRRHKIPTSAYLDRGRYPVIDQGQSVVAAWSNDAERVMRCPDGGVIVFGDHTRAVKFVDTDFLLGADGTHVLVAKDARWSTKFFYYQLQNKDIPNTGYNRHLGFVKEASFAIPTAAEQTAIVQVMSDIDDEISASSTRRDKLVAIREGMRQALLTGQTRLLGPGEPSE